MSTAPAAQEIRDYLLRRMSESGRTRFEAAYFADDALLDRVESEEDLLVSDYVLGKLTESDRRRFEGSLMGTPYYQERVETTSRLKQRLSQHRAFIRPSRAEMPAAPVYGRRIEDRSTRPALAPEDRLFPGRTGIVVAFSLLGLLLLASFASALRLRSELEKAREKPAPLPVAARASTGGVVPIAETVVFDTGLEAGPGFRSLERADGTPMLFVFPNRLLPRGIRQWEVSLMDAQNQAVWTSGRQVREPSSGSDFAVRLPPGVPPPGRVTVLLRVEAEAGSRNVFCGVLELVPPQPR
ncbi:MAG: hypothetical protein ABIT01_16625 [Thermoanaerobaculia bacterium]